MITIIHGDDQVSARKFLDEFKKNFNEIQILSENTSISELTFALHSNSFFSEKKLVILEDFLTKKGAEKERKNILDIISSTESDIVLFEEKEVPKKTLSQFPNATINVFKLPKSLFQFLESISPQNYTKSLYLFQSAQKTSEDELLFFMLVRHFRLLIALSDQDQETIDEVKRLATWQKSKLQKQANYFTSEQLLENYKELFFLDRAHKTGKRNIPLRTSIDFFLLKI